MIDTTRLGFDLYKNCGTQVLVKVSFKEVLHKQYSFIRWPKLGLRNLSFDKIKVSKLPHDWYHLLGFQILTCIETAIHVLGKVFFKEVLH